MQIELVVILLAIIGVVGAVSRQLRIAMPILLVIIGMIISLVPNIATVRLEPNTVFFIFLPPLLYIDSFNTSWRDLKSVGDLIALQAIGLVLATVVGVAALIHFVIPSMPWSVAFVLGAIVSPTDAVAAAAIAKEVTLPKRILDVIKGESLVNDATGLVTYQFAVAATVTGLFSWSEVGMRFIYIGFGGILVGLILGWGLSILRTRLDHRPIEIIGSLLSPFIVYLTAEHLHVSGVLAVVVAGLFLGWKGPTMLSFQARLHAAANWETITYILNGFSFLLMGLQLKTILETVKSYPHDLLILWTVTAALSPIMIRFLWTFSVAPVYAFLLKRSQPSWKNLFVVSWSGMRGIVSLAAALALPLACANGQAFPYRDLLIFLTIVVIVSTLLIQGVALPAIVKYFGFDKDLYYTTKTEKEARIYLAREAVRTIDEFAREKHFDVADPLIQKIINRYLDQTINTAELESNGDNKIENSHLLQNEALKSQRRVLLSMRDNHKIEDDLFKLLQHELDLEEVQLNGIDDLA